MKLVIDIPEKAYTIRKENPVWYDSNLDKAIANGIPLEEIPNPCIECSQNCCVRELNGEKCECQKVYVVKENKE